MSRVLLITGASAAAALALSGCGEVGCLDGNDPTCTVPSACEALSFTCEAGTATVRVLDSLDDLPIGVESLASPGDFLLANDDVWVVIDALDHPHLLVETGGTIVDMGTWDAGGPDVIQQVFQVVGLLPGEAPVYTDARIIEEGDVKAVQVTGHLQGNPDLFIATRYEIRPCEPGIRVRTEVVNRSPDPQSWLLLDAWWWGGRGALPFSPHAGGGFTWPEWGLLNLADGLREIPYLAGGMQGEVAAAYAEVPCDRRLMEGLHSTYVSGVGQGRFVAMPRDYEVFERFIAVAPGPDTAAATDVALELRRQLFEEAYVTVSGRVEAGGLPVAGAGLRASVEIAAGTLDTPAEQRTPITQVLPGPNGTWEARVPVSTELVVSVDAFGRRVAEVAAATQLADVDVGAIDIPESGKLTVGVIVDGNLDHGLVFVIPADPTTAAETEGSAWSHFETCAPYLGHANGGSPSCNRILTEDTVTVDIPPGRYHLYAAAGVFSSLAEVRNVEILAGEEHTTVLSVHTLPIAPEGTLSADFHVHGGASWDSAIPDEDRVRAWLASRVQVIASTEHNLAWDYAAALDALDARDRVQLINGTENTGVVLFPLIPDTLVPKVAGHWNFWPVPFDMDNPWRGSWYDQLVEPGQLMNLASVAGWPASTGVAQLNHPTSALFVGRDFGWADAIGLDLNRDLVTDGFDGTGHSLFASTPEGSPFSNADFHTTEVMNGTRNEEYLGYRAVWFYLLNQGLLRAGTANSDSHALSDNLVGVPLTLVYTDEAVGPDFDVDAFNASVRAGRMLGSNGPVVVATVEDGDASIGPSLEPFAPGASAELAITVRAAPWVPVDEVRILVNGEVVRTITDLPVPEEPLSYAPADILRYEGAIPLDELLPASGDAWIVVEAGETLPLTADLNCDGIPDTGDNDGDGAVDWRDVDGLDEDPGTTCLDTVGPRGVKPEPEPDSRRWLYQTIVTGGYAAGFTNPLVLDRDGDGQYLGVAR